MTNIDDYDSGHEDDVETFDFEEFRKAIYNWHDDIKEDLKNDKHNMTLLCVNAVLNTVEELMSDSTTIEETQHSFGSQDNTEAKLNKYGVNTNITSHILSENRMREIGFTDNAKDTWFFFRTFKDRKPDRKFTNEISFSVSIDKNNSDDLRIDILDEDFCQPYDYQHMLSKNPNNKMALLVQEFVEKWMEHLKVEGVLSGHEYGEYI